MIDGTGLATRHSSYSPAVVFIIFSVLIIKYHNILFLCILQFLIPLLRLMVSMTRRWARARTMAFYLLVATLSAEVGAFSPQLLSSSLLCLMPRKHQKSAHTLAIHRDCLAKRALPRTQAPYLSAPWSRRRCGRCRSPCKMALDSDGDDILYSSMDGEKSVSGSSDLTQAVEIAEQQRFIPNYNIDALGGKPMVVGLAGGTGSGKSTIMKIILEQTNSKDIGSHLLLQCLF